MNFVVPVLISARNRPLYLWATLDNLYRNTRHPHKFVLLDMASSDPSVRMVVAGFERRGMFDEVVWAERNDPEIAWRTAWRMSAGGAPYLGYVESDVIIESIDRCWLERLVELMERNSRLAMLGAAIDRSDFVDMETARRLEPQMAERQLHSLIKAESPERTQDLGCAGGADIFQPSYNPAGRVMLLRNSALREVGHGTDLQLHNKFLAAGYETGVATAVRHRHLSLLNIFDYPDYDTEARDRFMNGMRAMPENLTTDRGSGSADESPRAEGGLLSKYLTRFRSCLANASERPMRRANAASDHADAPSRLV